MKIIVFSSQFVLVSKHRVASRNIRIDTEHANTQNTPVGSKNKVEKMCKTKKITNLL